MIYRFCAVFILFLMTALPAMAEVVVLDSILVKVNDDIITRYDLDLEMKTVLQRMKASGQKADAAQQRGIEKQLLENMIQEMLLDQEIEKYGIKVSEEDIDNEIANIKKRRNMDDAAFLEQLTFDGLTMEELREKLKSSIQKQNLIGHMVHSKVVVTDSEIKKVYDSRMDQYSTGELVDISVIILPPEVAATEVSKRIEDGEMTFAEAAQKYSIGPAASQGGNIGEVARADISDEWLNALKGLAVGQASQPINVQGREALLMKNSESEGRVTPLESVKDEIYEELLSEKRKQVFDEYFDGLRDSAVIQYMN